MGTPTTALVIPLQSRPPIQQPGIATSGVTANDYNATLRAHATLVDRAYRAPIVPGCDLPPITSPSALVQRQSLLSAIINCAAAGDNVVIPSLIGDKLIYELILWNVTAQSIAIYQGPSANGILKLKLTSFPATSGFVLGFNGSFEQPHVIIDAGQQLIINLSGGTQLDGLIRYRQDTGSTF